MYNYLNLPRVPYLVYAFVLLFITSCNGNEDTKKNTAPPMATTPGQTASLSPGKLDTLYVERQAFDTLGNGAKLVFSFTFKAADTLTLHGWLVKGPNFDSLPNLKLKNWHASTYSYGTGTYFGNVVLRNQEIVKIKSSLNSNSNYVLFAPFLLGNNIMYKIFVSDKLYGPKDQILVISPTGADANPSPPKSY